MTPFILFVLMLISYLLNSAASRNLQIQARNTQSTWLSGEEAAKKVLSIKNIKDVSIQNTELEGDDYYNPVNKSIQLGADVYNKKNVYAMAIGAHEAIHAADYQYLRYLNVPISKIKKLIFLPLFVLSFFISSTILHGCVIGLFIFFVLFKLLVEVLDEVRTNKGAMNMLKQLKVPERELNEAKKIYKKMNLTYFSGLFFILF